MLLGDLIEGVPLLSTAQYDPSIEVTSVTHDSRQARPGTVFIAVPGFHHDGLEFADGAIERGAGVVVAARLPDEPVPGVTYLVVADVRCALAQFARRVAGAPDQRMRMFAVTGTNGKTSVAYLLAAILRSLGRKVGVMGTIGFDIDGTIIETPNTTPEAPILHELLRDAADGGVQDVVMEVSSHSLELGRVHGIEFDVVMFTNLSADHLELHGDMEKYYAAKAKLFAHAHTGVCVIDIDGEWGARAANECLDQGVNTVRVSARAGEAELCGLDIVTDVDGTRFDLVVDDEHHPVHLKAIGEYNVHNALVAAAAARASGYSVTEVAMGLGEAEPVTGRLERVPNDEGLNIFIDYAHTADALDACLRAVHGLAEAPVTLVFGVLGDRPTELRREMGWVAGAGADHVILTEDDLKAGTLETVVADVSPALDRSKASWEFIPNRWDAIGRAVACARNGDTVVITGKGHERHLILPHGQGPIPLDEGAVVLAAIGGRNPRELDPRGL